MTRILVVSVIAVALSACAQRPPIALQPNQSPAVAAGEKLEHLHELVRQIVTADYVGDRQMLDRLYSEADGFLGDKVIESRVRFWKGFAKWRRAMNGANEAITPTDLADDVEIAADQMRRSGEIDPEFVDARIGEMQCLGLMLFFDHKRVGGERIARLRALMNDLEKTAADKPRYVWAWGMAYFTVPPEKGGGPVRVINAYLGALDKVRNGVRVVKTPLDPSWGEAELCVNLAYSYLNQPMPDLTMARKYVDEAINLVPNWHYARDILRPQIEAAAKKMAEAGEPGR